MNFTEIGLCGPAGSGKDVVADWFIQKGFAKVAFSDPMKRFVQQCFGYSTERLWGPSQGRNQEDEVLPQFWFEAIGHLGTASWELINEVLDERVRIQGYLKLLEWLSELRKKYETRISPRVILQTLGTEWGRAVDPLIWVNYVFRVVVPAIREGRSYGQAEGIGDAKWAPLRNTPGVIIPDVRFKNELDAAQAHGGYVMRLRRISMEPKTVGIDGHASEAEQKGIPDEAFDLTLELPEGIDKVHIILDKLFQEEAWKLKRKLSTLG